MSFEDLPPQDLSSFSPPARAYFVEALARSRPVYENAPNRSDIAYGDDYWQKLDIFLPQGTAHGSLPVLMFMHGGGWTHGYKEQCGFMAPAITALPAIFISVSYRLAPQVRFPTPLEDIVSAIAWVRGNIAEYGGDPDRLFIGGHSAGGHLATMATLQTERLATAGLPVDVIKGCLPVSASFEFAVGMLEREGKLLLAKPEDAPIASPINSIGESRTPFHIIRGDRDLERCMISTDKALAVFDSKGWPLTSAILPDTDHFEAHLNVIKPETGWVERFASMAGVRAQHKNPRNSL